MRTYIQRLQKKTCFTSWSARAMKIGLCDVPPIGHHAAMLSLFNTTSMSTLLKTVNSQLMRLYNRKVICASFLKTFLFSLRIVSRHTLITTYKYLDLKTTFSRSVPKLLPAVFSHIVILKN